MKRFLLLLYVAIIAASCTKNPVNPVPPGTLKAINLATDSLNLYVGETKQLSFTLNPSTYSVKSLVFKSSDSTTVAVSNIGLLTAKKTGAAVITIENNGNTINVNCLVTVSPVITVDSLKTGLLAFYPFTYDTAVDSSGNGNNGNYSELTSVPDRFGNANAAFYFYGGSITVLDKPALRLSNTDFTVNAWVNLKAYSLSNSPFAPILSKRVIDNSGNSKGWLLGINASTGTAFFSTEGSTNNNVAGIKPVSLSNWHMVTAVYNFATTKLTLYVDGGSDTSATGILSPDGSVDASLLIGLDGYNPITSGYIYINSTLDDIRIYGKALSTSQVQQLYHLTH